MALAHLVVLSKKNCSPIMGSMATASTCQLLQPPQVQRVAVSKVMSLLRKPWRPGRAREISSAESQGLATKKF